MAIRNRGALERAHREGPRTTGYESALPETGVLSGRDDKPERLYSLCFWATGFPASSWVFTHAPVLTVGRASQTDRTLIRGKFAAASYHSGGL